MLEEIRRALWGKSHYFDADTCRFFNARCSSWRRIGRFILCVESRAPKPSWGIGRTYRIVVCDIDNGEVKTFNSAGAGGGVEHDWKTGEPARKRVRMVAGESWCESVMDGTAKDPT